MKKSQNFEQAMKRLEEISQTLESGDISLEDSIKLYQEGTKLIEFCQGKLDEAQKMVQKLSRNASGDLEISALDDDNLPEEK
ncbi:MAG: exodeoxyribonuclease VII small subunit [Caldithrix sp. RBG_13_44_9]|nr:MAG: exodeoxyribonuclease VII small subunit [Caldithrix sp. RBG_13_44_9]